MKINTLFACKTENLTINAFIIHKMNAYIKCWNIIRISLSLSRYMCTHKTLTNSKQQTPKDSEYAHPKIHCVSIYKWTNLVLLLHFSLYFNPSNDVKHTNDCHKYVKIVLFFFCFCFVFIFSSFFYILLPSFRSLCVQYM